jgi:hypothetical protein
MGRLLARTLVILMLATAANVRSDTLRGAVGISAEWGSGWIDLSSVTKFNKGEKIRIKVGGTAKRILVRFLPKGESPDSAVGIIGGSPFEVPADRIVTFELRESHPSVVQISVHGGESPWSHHLGERNGPATLEKVERQPP